jgi:hypothetical protein
MSFPNPSHRYIDPLYWLQRGWPLNARKDAASGDVDAKLFLAFDSFTTNSNENSGETLRWHIKAAAQGDPDAIKNLVRLYRHGRCGVKMDLVKACEWMATYLNSDCTERNPNIVKTFLYDYGMLLVGADTNEPHQKLPLEMQDAKKGCELLERAGEIFNCMDSIKTLGGMLYISDQFPKIPRDLDKGMYWLLKGAQNGDGKSAYQLAMLFSCGLIPVNRELELKWFLVAVKLGFQGKIQFVNHLSQEKANKRLRNIERDKDIEQFLPTDETKACSNPRCSNLEEDTRFNTCVKCKHTKYCSKECQVVHWKTGGHRKECPLLEKQKEAMKEINRNSVLPDARVCFNPDCYEKEKDGITFQKCSRCKAAIYCSRDCQKAHYKAGHKKVCKKFLKYLDEANKLLERAETFPTTGD